MSTVRTTRLSTGVAGLDNILNGGLEPNRAYMIRGESGTGKTILGYHFLTAGSDCDDQPLFIAFEEQAAAIRTNAAHLGFDLEDVPIVDLSPSAEEFLDEGTYSILDPSEVEGHSVASRIGEAVDEHNPDRVVIDPLTQLRHLSPDEYQFNQTAAALISYLKKNDATTLFTSQPTRGTADEDLQYLCDGSITLERSPDHRTLIVDKYRGSSFQNGRHSLRITDTGMHVYPKLVPEQHSQPFSIEPLSSGIDELDSLLSGGIERGSTTLISGPTGVGKSTTGTAFARAAAERGDRALIYLFEESAESFRHRSEAINIPIDELVDSGALELNEMEPLSMSANEFAERVRTQVEEHGAEFVMIDGISGYRIGLTDDDDVRAELHALARYLRNMGVTVILTDELTEVTGAFQVSEANVSHLADNIIFIRYIEVDGDIRKAIGVLKKRFGEFESTLRSFTISSDGVAVGEPLTGLRGILTGTPTTVGTND